MAVRRLRIRRRDCLGLDGNLQLPGESLCVALAYTDRNGHSHSHGNRDAYCYRGAEVYADAQAASHTAASSVRSASTVISSGTRDHSRVPVTRTFLFTRSASSSSTISWRRTYVLRLQ